MMKGSSIQRVLWRLKTFLLRMLVIGGGIIGLEMATVYMALGSKVSIVEMSTQLMPVRTLIGCRLRSVLKSKPRASPRKPGSALWRQIRANSRSNLRVTRYRTARHTCGTGRGRPLSNGHYITAEAAGVSVDDKGFISVDKQQRTNQEHIFAIGDIVGQPMLAHKATCEGKVAAEVAAGLKSGFEARVIPSGRLHRSRGCLGGSHRNRGNGEED